MAYKALVIDDETLARELILDYLKDIKEIEVIGQCSNGFEALKTIQESKPDLIFLDVQMPKLSGFEMLELLDTKPVIIFYIAYYFTSLRSYNTTSYNNTNKC